MILRIFPAAAICLAFFAWCMPAAAEEQVFLGVLAEGDRIDEERMAYADDYNVELEAGQLVTIRLTAGEGTDLDTYLKVLGPGEQALHNDDGPDGSNSLLMFHVPETGTWRITATSYGERETGPYELRISTEALVAVLEEEGELSELSPRLLKNGEYYRVHTTQVEAGKRYAVALSSEDFDAYVAVHFPGGFDSNDDGIDGSTNSFLIFEPAESGEVKLVATSFGQGATGKYKLILSESPARQ